MNELRSSKPLFYSQIQRGGKKEEKIKNRTQNNPNSRIIQNK